MRAKRIDMTSLPKPPPETGKAIVEPRAIPCRLKVMHAIYTSNLDASLRPVALAFAWFANDDGGNVWPAISTVSRMIRWSERTIQRRLLTLLKLGVLELEDPIKGRSGGMGKTARYRFNLEILAQLPAEESVEPRQPRHPFPLTEPRQPRHPLRDQRVTGETTNPDTSIHKPRHVDPSNGDTVVTRSYIEPTITNIEQTDAGASERSPREPTKGDPVQGLRSDCDAGAREVAPRRQDRRPEQRDRAVQAGVRAAPSRPTALRRRTGAEGCGRCDPCPSPRCQHLHRAVSTDRRARYAMNCPGCGLPDVLPGRVYCRPSCGSRHQHRESQSRPNLFNGLTLVSEWPTEDDDGRRRQHVHHNTKGALVDERRGLPRWR